jgi:hypothetical protein
MSLHEAPTDQRIPYGQKGLMELGQPLIPDAPPAELMPPRERVLHHPAVHTQAIARELIGFMWAIAKQGLVTL